MVRCDSWITGPGTRPPRDSLPISILVRSAADVRGPRLRRIGLISPRFIFGTVWVRRRDGLGVFGIGGGREQMWILIARWWRIRCGG